MEEVLNSSDAQEGQEIYHLIFQLFLKLLFLAKMRALLTLEALVRIL